MKTGRLEVVLDLLKPGQRVFVQGGPGESLAFIDLLKANPGAVKNVEFWSCLIPGINTFDYGSLPDGPNLVSFMASPSLEASIATGRTRVNAMPYSEIGATLSGMAFDVAIFHTAPEQARSYSFSLSSEAGGLVWSNAKTRVVLANERMPYMEFADALPADAADLVVPVDAPLLAPPKAGPRGPVMDAIAKNAVGLVPDGAVIQSGIGEAPGAAVGALQRHERLKVHSGIVTREYMVLAEAGALEPGARHLTGVAWGDVNFADWLKREELFAFASCLETHGHEKIAAHPNFVSIGSAIEVDLEGNINLEWVDGRRVSSVGGAPDFMRGAAASVGGRSIIALPSTARSGQSRIVTKLAQAPSVAAGLADAIVTEHGVAELRGKSSRERAKLLMTIAAPEHRDTLAASRGG